jgi:hypothetical protein
MRFQSIKVILLLAAFITEVSTAAGGKKRPPPPPPQFPTFSVPHERAEQIFTYCEQFAPHAKALPKANYNHFASLCKLLPNNLTLPLYDPASTDHCQNFTSGTATAEFCNLDICSGTWIFNMQRTCDDLVRSCFGSKKVQIGYTRAYIRTRNPKGYIALSVNGSTPAIEDLEPVCNGTALENGAVPAVPNTDYSVPDTRQWWKEMEKLIENKEHAS